MPSKDDFHEKRPELNEGLSFDQGKRRVIVRRAMSGTVQRLARRLNSSPDELAQKIPADTIRRTKYAVKETVNEDGTREFKEPIEVIDGPHSLIHR